MIFILVLEELYYIYFEIEVECHLNFCWSSEKFWLDVCAMYQRLFVEYLGSDGEVFILESNFYNV